MKFDAEYGVDWMARAQDRRLLISALWARYWNTNNELDRVSNFFKFIFIHKHSSNFIKVQLLKKSQF